MTIHFAPAKDVGPNANCPSVSRVLDRVSLGAAANDNGKRTQGLSSFPPPSQDMLEAALRHFGDHGLGAARAARIRAKQAFFEGDRAAYDWWLGITQTLDRRISEETLHLPQQSRQAANLEPITQSCAPESAG